MLGVISAGGPETAAAGAEMLKLGGNAVDAAVAAAFASFIAEIGVVHLGGSGIAQIFSPEANQAITYDFFSNMPGIGGEKPKELDFEGVTIDFGATTQEFYLGRASVAVPGNIAGLCKMATDHGRLAFETLLQPAIRLARDGTLIAKFQAETCKLLEPLYTHTSGMRDIFLKDGRMIRPGERLYIPNLEATLNALASEGEGQFRHGHLADAILSDQAKNGGMLTSADLQQYEVYVQPSISLPYRDYDILLPPPSSTGGVLTAFTLKLISAFDVSRRPHGSAAHLRLLYETMAATTRARVLWETLGSERSAETAVSEFLSDSVVQAFIDQIEESLAKKHASEAMPEPRGPSDTSHISVIDAEGLAVSLTTTAGESAGYVVPKTGFIPNNIMGEADLHPRGFHSRPPGERIPTMMTPTIVLRNGKTRLVVGSGGSIRIRSAILQVLSNLLDYRMTLAESVNAPRVHVEEGTLQCEAGFGADAVDELELLGYPVNRWDSRSIYFGGAHSVSRTNAGRLVAAGDNRRGGSVAKV